MILTQKCLIIDYLYNSYFKSPKTLNAAVVFNFAMYLRYLKQNREILTIVYNYIDIKINLCVKSYFILEYRSLYKLNTRIKQINFNTCLKYSGKALVDKFSVECSQWLDEGVYMERNLTRDEANGEPLTYLYETVTKRNLSTGVNDVKTELFRGGDSLLFIDN